jgi:hypothetical protein
MPWPMTRSLGVEIGKLSGAAVTTRCTSGTAARTDQCGLRCVYQSVTGTRAAASSGAHITANRGIMWAKQAS